MMGCDDEDCRDCLDDVTISGPSNPPRRLQRGRVGAAARGKASTSAASALLSASASSSLAPAAATVILEVSPTAAAAPVANETSNEQVDKKGVD